MTEKHHTEYRQAISASGKDIYAPTEFDDPNYWIPNQNLEALLNEGLRGVSVAGLPNRTRSKAVKQAVCEALGYPVPKSFKKTKPTFIGQQLDIATQKASNVQIYNEEISPARRYAVIQVCEDGSLGKVRVINGQELAILDTTGTITKKYQAKLKVGKDSHELISPEDTTLVLPYVKSNLVFDETTSPVEDPQPGKLYPISEIFQRLTPLLGREFQDPGMDQERNRGAALHSLVCQALGYSRCEDTGQFPDIKHQLLEVKLQTSPTIDLGLVEPSSEELLDVQKLGDTQPRHCDTRYAMFYAKTDGKTVTLTHLFVTTGEKFFTRFRKFGGKGVNGKKQIPLPRDFFA
jgi:hypothetical protein